MQEQGIDNPKYLLPNDRVRFKKPSFDRFSENPRVIFQTGEEVIIGVTTVNGNYCTAGIKK